ncbi:MAG TPA: hypothetical protein VM536_04070, partial [Chloroflexia bacterium]|nr:hypothetical protein [Chloroflexia bacterium]
MSPYAYQAYGLIIYSALELPELTPAPARPQTPDLTISLGTVPWPGSIATVTEGKPGPRFAVGAAGEIYQSFPDAGAFEMRAGTEIVVDPAEGVSGDELRLYLLGPALALALHQRG